ncbi:MAG: haloacid dehalogenase-like hydrolase [Kiritimatiellae bacterium]|nr:haloacid dehalogenase-like hydrolase [Kiritimatiellia bacterium]
MKKTLLAIFAAALCSAAAVADNADVVTARILANVAKLKAADPEAVPMAFWDFDGTIIKGDVSDGLVENGRVAFKGLVQRTIESGLSPVYASVGGWDRFRADYARFREIGCWLAWPYLAQIYAGAVSADIDGFCRREYTAVYRKWYFAFSVKVMKSLAAAGVENCIISGSPEAYVRNAADTVGVPRCRIRGIRVAEPGGRFTTRLLYPMPFEEGKIENLREIVAARPHGVAIAGFGNSYRNDAPFMRYIVAQPSLPGGAKGTAVMINGANPVPGYAEHFICIEETRVVGE